MPSRKLVKTTITFTVNGPGQIPFDMLRYDGAYPATSEDAAEIERRSHRENGLNFARDVAQADQAAIDLRAHGRAVGVVFVAC